jgi:hypothetical protein
MKIIVEDLKVCGDKFQPADLSTGTRRSPLRPTVSVFMILLPVMLMFVQEFLEDIDDSVVFARLLIDGKQHRIEQENPKRGYRGVAVCGGDGRAGKQRRRPTRPGSPHRSLPSDCAWSVIKRPAINKNIPVQTVTIILLPATEQRGVHRECPGGDHPETSFANWEKPCSSTQSDGDIVEQMPDIQPYDQFVDLFPPNLYFPFDDPSDHRSLHAD